MDHPARSPSSTEIKKQILHVLGELVYYRRPPEPEDTELLWARSTARQIVHDAFDEEADMDHFIELAFEAESEEELPEIEECADFLGLELEV